MWALNEPIARMANAKGICAGRLWESRFKSQALLDEKALAACMAYVDLNPVRAKMAKTPKGSEHPSIKRRIENKKSDTPRPLKLAEFIGNPREPMPQGLPFHLKDYIELVDITGRAIREDKRGYTDQNQPPILERLDISSKEGLVKTTEFGARFRSIVGCKEKLHQAVKALGIKRRAGLRACQTLLH